MGEKLYKKQLRSLKFLFYLCSFISYIALLAYVNYKLYKLIDFMIKNDIRESIVVSNIVLSITSIFLITYILITKFKKSERNN